MSVFGNNSSGRSTEAGILVSWPSTDRSGAARLGRGRERLRRGLTRRGVSLAGLGAVLSGSGAQAALPPGLLQGTLHAATALVNKSVLTGIVSPTGRLTDMVAQQLPGPALMMVNKGIAFRLIGTVGRSTFSRLGRGLPFVGGAVSAGVDAYMLKRIADHAKDEFPLRVANAVTAGQVTPS